MPENAKLKPNCSDIFRSKSKFGELFPNLIWKIHKDKQRWHHNFGARFQPTIVRQKYFVFAHKVKKGKVITQKFKKYSRPSVRKIGYPGCGWWKIHGRFFAQKHLWREMIEDAPVWVTTWVHGCALPNAHPVGLSAVPPPQICFSIPYPCDGVLGLNSLLLQGSPRSSRPAKQCPGPPFASIFAVFAGHHLLHEIIAVGKNRIQPDSNLLQT